MNYIIIIIIRNIYWKTLITYLFIDLFKKYSFTHYKYILWCTYNDVFLYFYCEMSIITSLLVGMYCKINIVNFSKFHNLLMLPNSLNTTTFYLSFTISEKASKSVGVCDYRVDIFCCHIKRFDNQRGSYSKQSKL